MRLRTFSQLLGFHGDVEVARLERRLGVQDNARPPHRGRIELPRIGGVRADGADVGVRLEQRAIEQWSG